MRKTFLSRRGIQLDVFRKVPSTPTWPALPPETTRQVQRLLVRLLREHGAPASHEGKEASNE